MLVASELKGELARIRPARPCCRRAELAGLLYGARERGGVRTLDHATARIAVELAGQRRGLALAELRSAPPGTPGRHHLHVPLSPAAGDHFRWRSAADHDRRAFLRGVLLGSTSISLGGRGPHLEFVFRDRRRGEELLRRLADSGVRGGIMERRGRHVVYLKGQEEIAGLLRLTGASRALLDFETRRVERDVRNRLNRLLNAEGANLARSVRAAARQLRAIDELEASGRLAVLPVGLREAATVRRARPDDDLEGLALASGLSRSAMNHRLRRLVELASTDTAA